MLKGVPTIISPQLLAALCAMGHGDEIIIGDGNFPAESQGVPVIRCDGHNVPELFEAILKLFPLDNYVDHPITLMEVVKGDDFKPVIWEKFKEILSENGYGPDVIEYEERFDFYERAKKAFVIISTSEFSKYANIILKKGIITPTDIPS